MQLIAAVVVRTCAAALLAACVACAVSAQEQSSSRSSLGLAGQPDFGGTWERYTPPRDPNAAPSGAGGGLGPTFGGAPPPLKPQFAAAYEADVRMRQEAERRGEPGALLKQVTLPDGRVFANGGPAGPALIQ